MEWKLYVRNENFREPVESCTSHSSQADALRSAYILVLRPSLLKKPFLIEGPDGQRMDREQIETWCRDHQAQ
jgi:hypothetical protein